MARPPRAFRSHRLLRDRVPTELTSPQMLRRYGASARSARARRSYDRVMDDVP